MVWAAERRRFVLAIAILLALGSAAALTRLTFDHDVLHLLPQRGAAVQAFARYLSLFGSLDRSGIAARGLDRSLDLIR